MYGDLWAWVAEEPGKAAAAAVMIGIPAAGALAQQRQKDRARSGRSDASAPRRAGDTVLVRFLAGRDIKPGDPSSSASWWCAGEEVVRDRTAADLAAGAPDAPGKQQHTVLRTITAGAGRWSCWPGVARASVRLVVPAAVVAGWSGWWSVAAAGTGVLSAAGVAAAVTGPAVLGWWRPRPAGADLVHGPGMWAALRPALGVDESQRRERWLVLSDDVSVPGARVVLRLPAGWPGGEAGKRAITAAVTDRLPGEWSEKWHRADSAPFAEWIRKEPPRKVPTLPESVEWKASRDPYQVYVGQAVRGYDLEDVVIRTKSATPHFGVGGLTGSGKSTVLYLGVVHARENGVLVDILDTKQNSMAEAEGKSGVRVHKTPAECVAALGEYLMSMMAAETAIGKTGDPALRQLLVPRLMVADELPTMMKMALIWWKYQIKGRGIPPFAEWFSIGLLQGRSADHRFGVGAQQWANAYFGGTMERAQIGWKAQLGFCDSPSWAVAFGASTPMVSPDTTVPGRGVFADGRINPETNGLWAREFQPAYIVPEVSTRLDWAPSAPAWFDAGERAPWITAETLRTAESLAIPDFLVGGRLGPAHPVMGGAVTLRPNRAVGVVPPRSGAVTGVPVTAGVTGGVTGASGAAPQPAVELFSLAEACGAGLLPWDYATAKVYKGRSAKKGIEFPSGIPDGRVTYYARDEIEDWLERWQASAQSRP
ncbi:hypothetical protein OG444_40495 (plasmid) [Streptomyces sp. NBC_01232]|uniref:hypothetical protein n=1 Tax=Streptomyces sp. NBC_01232 TaxID=2903786 RepID=UPI002E155E79|nr:hypothetical protein OG444_40495 [Streptomyces sp. NBC_01232]